MTLPLPHHDTINSCARGSHATAINRALNVTDAERIARVFKAVGDPARVRLLSLIAASGDSTGACICDLTVPVGLSQPTVSHHMKQLVDAGLVTREQRGRWAHFRVVEGALDTATRTLLPK